MAFTFTFGDPGGSRIVTVGTITSGTWQANAVGVGYGGTGGTAFTAYAPICAGTTTTGTFQVASTNLSTTGNVLTSNGSSQLPSFLPVPVNGVVVNQSSSSVTMAASHLYLINNGASLVTLTLATSPNVGDTYTIIGGSSGGWKVAQNASQLIELPLGNHTTAGTGGSISSSNTYDTIQITYSQISNTFVVTHMTGNPTYV